MTFRYARHTNRLNEIINFYTKLLGFQVLGKFENHNNYTGVFLGLQNAGWHLEFTESNYPANHNFDEDDILVFYASTEDEFNSIINRFEDNKMERVEPKNPYWKNNGVMFLDPDGFRIIVSPLQWKL